MTKNEKLLQKIYFHIKQVSAFSRMLIFPLLLLSAIGLAYAGWAFRSDPYIYREMPVIMVYCNERDLSRSERTQALKDPDQVIARCYERAVWPGTDNQSVRGLAQQKADDILYSLFSNPKNANIVRSEATNTLKYFVKGSMAYTNYKQQADVAISLANKSATTFKIKSQYLRKVEEGESLSWVAKYEGIWVIGSDKQSGKHVTLYVVMSPIFGESRNANRQAIMVREMEVSIDDKSV